MFGFKRKGSGARIVENPNGEFDVIYDETPKGGDERE
jgi:hypothetical protein